MDNQSVSVPQKSELHYSPVAFDAIREDPRHTQDGHISRAVSLHPLLLTLPFFGPRSNGARLYPFMCSNTQPITNGIYTTTTGPKDLAYALAGVESESTPRIIGAWGDFGALASYMHGFVGG